MKYYTERPLVKLFTKVPAFLVKNCCMTTIQTGIMGGAIR
jgi:hypothetical protein